MRWYPTSKSPDTFAEARCVGVAVTILQTVELRVKETPTSPILAVFPAEVWIDHITTVSVVETGKRSTPVNKR